MKTAVLVPVSACLLALVLPSPARADWQQVSFDIAATGSGVAQPSVATGFIYPEIECDDGPDACKGELPYPVTRIAYVDESGVKMVTRFGGPGQPWSEPRLVFAGGRLPSLILDSDGEEIITFAYDFSDASVVYMTRGVEPGTGNNDIDVQDQNIHLVTRSEDHVFTMPSPPVVQYHGFETSDPRRVHVVYSLAGELWHAYIAEDDYYDHQIDFTEFPIGDDIFWEGADDYEPDDVRGTWPAAAPLWTDDYTVDGPFNYEPMPAIAYDRYGVDFRRMRESNQPIKNWTDRVQIGGSWEQRPSIDAAPHGPPNVAWAPSCDEGGHQLYFRRAELREPTYIGEWLPLESTGAENACEPSLSLGLDRVPYIAYVDPYAGSVNVTVRDAEGGWAHDTIDEGSQPSMDYNPNTELQTIAYVDPSSSELRVVDGYWY